jgi:hypothetical protein
LIEYEPPAAAAGNAANGTTLRGEHAEHGAPADPLNEGVGPYMPNGYQPQPRFP